MRWLLELQVNLPSGIVRAQVAVCPPMLPRLHLFGDQVHLAGGVSWSSGEVVMILRMRDLPPSVGFSDQCSSVDQCWSSRGVTFFVQNAYWFWGTSFGERGCPSSVGGTMYECIEYT